MVPLPVDPFIPEILAAVRRDRALVLSAPPGAGKTTRVPPALAADGPVIVLQPRRIAARSIARRIAAEQGWTIGREVGWQVRFERQFGDRTQVLVATEGILTARLQLDPLLSGFRTIVLDEFHERSIHADLGLALGRQAWLANGELRIVVMSATLDTARVAAFLGGCPVIDVPTRPHPVDVGYQPGEGVAAAVVSALAATSGHVLAFLPGAPEISRALPQVRDRVGPEVEVVELHGSLDPAGQDQALQPSSRRRAILATNIAETSLTVPGVTAVVDTGLHKVARYDPERAIDSLEIERITADSAEQRAGRAARLGPGVVRRLWDARDRLRPHREPEIARVDLASTVLDLIAWGADPRAFEWFEAPPPDAVDAALALLERLGAVEGGTSRITRLGDELRRLPLHPRLARILIESKNAREAAAACALLSERHYLAPRSASTASDLLSALDHWAQVPSHVKNVASHIAATLNRLEPPRTRSNPVEPVRTHSNLLEPVTEREFRRWIVTGYPDRVAQRRTPNSPRVLLASGHGAVVGPESGVREGEYLVAIDVTAGRRGEGSEARIRVASRVEREWLRPDAEDVVHVFDEQQGVVRAARIERYGALVLAEHPCRTDPATAARLLADAYLARPLPAGAERLVRRLRFAAREIEFAALVRDAAAGAARLDDIDPSSALPRSVLTELSRLAPEGLVVPSGSTVRLDYRDDGSVSAAVKLQELFGLAETPRLGPRQAPVIFELLAPNGRPVQVTRDLRSFWERTYPDVRKELRARYPKHPWPEDPWTATPTRRTVRKGQK
jgi:ATP-dependent helicase HrpB